MNCFQIWPSSSGDVIFLFLALEAIMLDGGESFMQFW